jgi:hypothetical protein
MHGAFRGVAVTALPVAILALGATGCGSSSANSQSGGSSSASSSAAAAASTTAAVASTSAAGSSTAAAGSGAAPKPGAKLAVGQPVTLPFDTTTSSGGNGPSYKLQVTVTSIRKGTLADFKGIQLDASEKAGIPYYVSVTLTNLGPGAINSETNDPTGAIQGIDNTGEPQDDITFLFGNFAPCPQTTLPNPLKPGKTVKTCLTFLIPGGITKVGYTGTQNYFDTPATWSAS